MARQLTETYQVSGRGVTGWSHGGRVAPASAGIPEDIGLWCNRLVAPQSGSIRPERAVATTRKPGRLHLSM